MLKKIKSMSRLKDENREVSLIIKLAVICWSLRYFSKVNISKPTVPSFISFPFTDIIPFVFLLLIFSLSDFKDITELPRDTYHNIWIVKQKGY